MKKLLAISFVLLMAQMPSLALTTEEASTVDYLENRGHSMEMAKLVDFQKSKINGTEPTFKSKDPDYYTSDKRVNFIRKVFMYFDPALDDGQFMKHDINYSNRWDDL